MKMTAQIDEWELKSPLRISEKEFLITRSLVVTISAGGARGRGEGQGVYYLNETAESMLEQVHSVANCVANGITRDKLLHVLPAGGARNAIDCALWDWEAKHSGRSIWEMVGIDPAPVVTVYTIGLDDSPVKMAANAAAAADFPVLKIKLDADRPLQRLEAIRAARPDAEIVVDANQGWSIDLLTAILPRCQELGISMIEQPLPRGSDDALDGLVSPVQLAADESCLDTSEFEAASSRYDIINIKLDKTGGLTEALRLAKMARENGNQLMVGNMSGTSLSMAPSFIVAQLCDFVDIDGPLLLKDDRPGGLNYSGAKVSVFSSEFWG